MIIAALLPSLNSRDMHIRLARWFAFWQSAPALWPSDIEIKPHCTQSKALEQCHAATFEHALWQNIFVLTKICWPRLDKFQCIWPELSDERSMAASAGNLRRDSLYAVFATVAVLTCLLSI